MASEAILKQKQEEVSALATKNITTNGTIISIGAKFNDKGHIIEYYRNRLGEEIKVTIKYYK